MRLIDADALTYYGGTNGCPMPDIHNEPTIEAVPVIRCKDCKWWVKDKRVDYVGRCFGRDSQWMMHSDGFCSDAERRTDEID